MDEFTKQFYQEVMGEQELGAVPVDKLPPPVVPLQVAPPQCDSKSSDQNDQFEKWNFWIFCEL